MNGLLVIDKPGGMTSRDVVNRVQQWFPRKTKIGHTGTLDPLATGVLVVCIGAATRLADYVQAMSKSYASRFRLGVSSTTDDVDGVMTANPIETPPTRQQIELALESFVGMIDQIPPAFSALKVAGVRAYELARQGRGPELGSRVVHIDSIHVHDYVWPFLDVVIECGKGTYIRSIARDLGDMLGCGGLVQTLRRSRIGRFTAEQGIGLDTNGEDVATKLRPMSEAVMGLPRITLDRDLIHRLQTGQTVGYTLPFPLENPTQPIAVFRTTGELVGTILPHLNGMIRPAVMLRDQV